MIRSTSVGRVALAVLLAGCGLASAGCAGSSSSTPHVSAGDRSLDTGPAGTTPAAGPDPAPGATTTDTGRTADGSACAVLTHLYADLVADAMGLEGQSPADDGHALADQVSQLSGQVPASTVEDLRVVARAYGATAQALDAATPDDPATASGSTDGLDRRLDQVAAADRTPEVTGALARLSAYVADGCP
jgi:hypothetical protein